MSEDNIVKENVRVYLEKIGSKNIIANSKTKSNPQANCQFLSKKKKWTFFKSKNKKFKQQFKIIKSPQTWREWMQLYSITLDHDKKQNIKNRLIKNATSKGKSYKKALSYIAKNELDEFIDPMLDEIINNDFNLINEDTLHDYSKKYPKYSEKFENARRKKLNREQKEIKVDVKKNKKRNELIKRKISMEAELSQMISMGSVNDERVNYFEEKIKKIKYEIERL